LEASRAPYQAARLAAALRARATSGCGPIARAGADIVHVIAVGGDPGVARELKRSAPFWQLRRRFGSHQVDARVQEPDHDEIVVALLVGRDRGQDRRELAAAVS
jgi:hypothetical protein